MNEINFTLTCNKCGSHVIVNNKDYAQDGIIDLSVDLSTTYDSYPIGIEIYCGVCRKFITLKY